MVKGDPVEDFECLTATKALRTEGTTFAKKADCRAVASACVNRGSRRPAGRLDSVLRSTGRSLHVAETVSRKLMITKARVDDY